MGNLILPSISSSPLGYPVATNRPLMDGMLALQKLLAEGKVKLARAEDQHLGNLCSRTRSETTIEADQGAPGLTFSGIRHAAHSSPSRTFVAAKSRSWQPARITFIG